MASKRKVFNSKVDSYLKDRFLSSRTSRSWRLNCCVGSSESLTRCLNLTRFCCVCSASLLQVLTPWVLSVTEVLSVLLIYFLGTTRSLVIHESPAQYHFSFWHSLEDVVLLSCTRAVLLSVAYASGMQHMHRPYLYSSCLLACVCFPFVVVKMILFRYGQDAVPAAAIFIITNLFCWVHVFAARHSVEFARRRYQLGLGTGYPWEDDLGLLAPDSWNPLLVRRSDPEEGSKSSGDLAGLAGRGGWGAGMGGGWGGDRGEDVPAETLADGDSKFLQLGDIKVHYKEVMPSTLVGCEEGQQLGIVLVHGFGAGVFAWRHVMEPLAIQCQCRVVAFDRPAFGLTSRPLVYADHPNPYTLGSQASLLLQLCRALGLTKVLLVAHADGCLLALRAASMAIRSALLSPPGGDVGSPAWDELDGVELGLGLSQHHTGLGHQASLTQPQLQQAGSVGDGMAGGVAAGGGAGSLGAGSGLGADNNTITISNNNINSQGLTSQPPSGLPPSGKHSTTSQQQQQPPQPGVLSTGNSSVVDANLVTAHISTSTGLGLGPQPAGSPANTDAASSATYSAAGLSRAGQDISVMSLQYTSDQASLPGSMELTLGGGWQHSVRSDTSLLGRLDSMDNAMLARYAKGARTIDIYPGEAGSVHGSGGWTRGEGVGAGGGAGAPGDAGGAEVEAGRGKAQASTVNTGACGWGQFQAGGGPGAQQQQGVASPGEGCSPHAGWPVTVLGLALLHPNLSGTQGPVLSRLLAGSRLGRSILRPLLRSEVGEVANRRAWHNTHKLTSEVLDLYKAPLRVEGWCESLIEITGLRREQAQGDLSGYLMDVQELPALLLTGEHDRVVPPPKVELLSADLPRSRMSMVPGCGHLSHEESPAALLSHLVPFCGQAMLELQQLEAARGAQAAGGAGQQQQDDGNTLA